MSLTDSFEEAYHAFHYSQTRLLSLRDRETTSAARPKKPRRSTGSRREHVSGAGTDHEAGAGRIEVERQERAVPEIELMRDCRPSSANLRPGSHPSGPSIGRTRSSCRIPTLARCFARPMTGRAAVSESRVRSPRFEPEGMFRTARRGRGWLLLVRGSRRRGSPSLRSVGRLDSAGGIADQSADNVRIRWPRT